MATVGLRRVAATALGLEALGLFALAAWQVVALVGGDTESIDSAIALVVLTVLGAVAVAAFAVAVGGGRSWGRSGGIVTQLLVLAVAIGAMTGAYAHPGIGIALAVPSLVVLVLLVLLARADAPKKDAAPRE